MDYLTKKLGMLPIEDRRKFNDDLYELLKDREWCLIHGINYLNPDVRVAKTILFNWYYKDKIVKKDEKLIEESAKIF